jgi:hypothetical protein
VVVLGEDRERRAGHADVGDHRADVRVEHGQRLVGVAQRRDLDRQQAPHQVASVVSHARDDDTRSRR